MPDPNTAWLVEIETAISEIRSFTVGMDEGAFVASALTCSATAMQLIVNGEAARRLSHAVQDEAPEIPWAQIVSLRSHIAHGYRSIDHKIVWDIVQEHLPPLHVAVHRMLAARGEANP